MKALALFSGGLDSTLAMKLIKDQGIDVLAVHINTGFGGTKDRLEHMNNMCNHIGVELTILDVRQAYLEEVLFEPEYGYGKHFNPCVDCHGFMFRHTSKLLEKYNAQFMISGEVVGQRPMSQNKHSMKKVEKLSLSEDLIVRPLSAKLLPPTKPEREGWIDRNKLMDFNGRGRSKQLKIAKEIGLKNFEEPSGGCLLTDKQFSVRLKDFISYDELLIDDIDALKFGRHFRLPDGSKLIIGRDESDNKKLEKVKSKKYLKGIIEDVKGPYVLIEKDISDNDKKLAINIILSYGKTELDKEYTINFGSIKLKGKKLLNKEIIKQSLVN